MKGKTLRNWPVIILLFLFSDAYGMPLLSFGDLRGHLEPCGCDPRTDVGGAARLAAAIGRYRSADPNLAILSTGNFLDGQGQPSPVSRALSRVIEELRPSVSLVNNLEWNTLEASQKILKVQWVLSNTMGPIESDLVKGMVLLNGEEIYGFLGRRSPKLLGAGSKLFARWRAESKLKDAKKRILLFSGSAADLDLIVKTKFFGTIIRSNSAPLGQEIADQEQKDEGRLVQPFKNGFTVWSVPFGGAGLLRLGGLESTPIPQTVEKIIQAPAANVSESRLFTGTIKSSEPNLKLQEFQMIHWLRPGEENGAPEAIQKIMALSKIESQNQFKLRSDIRLKELASSPFIGAQACEACHSSAYAVWKNSKHAGAINPLIEKSRHEDETCIECHVLGFLEKGGYVNEAASPKFANVQCENCHGPRAEHVLNPAIHPKSDPKKACLSCHTPPHSPGFDQSVYWSKIKHSI